MQVVYRAVPTSGPLQVGLAQNAPRGKSRWSRRKAKTRALHAKPAMFQLLAGLVCPATQESGRIPDQMCACCAQRIIFAEEVLVQSLVLPERKPPFLAQTARVRARRVP